MNDGEVDLAQINSRYVLAKRLSFHLLLIDTPKLIRRPCPSKFHERRCTPRPRHNQRGIPSSIGQDELSVPDANGRGFPLDPVVSAAAIGRLGLWIRLPPLPPGLERGVEALYHGIRAVGMKLI